MTNDDVRSGLLQVAYQHGRNCNLRRIAGTVHYSLSEAMRAYDELEQLARANGIYDTFYAAELMREFNAGVHSAQR